MTADIAGAGEIEHEFRVGRHFAVMILTVLTGFGIYGWVSVDALNDLRVKGPLYDKVVLNKDLIADILPPPEYIIEANLVVHKLALATTDKSRSEFIAELETLKKDYEARHQYWTGVPLGKEIEDAFLHRSYDPAMRFFKIVFERYIPAIRRGDAAAVAEADAQLDDAFEAHRREIDKVTMIINRRVMESEIAAETEVANTYKTLALVLALAVGAAVAYAIWMSRSLRRDLHQVSTGIKIAKCIGAGDCSAQLAASDARDGLTGALMHMQGNIKEMIHDACDLLEAAKAGRLGVRADTSKLEGEYGRIIEGVNQMLDTVVKPLNMASSYIDRLAHGDIPPKITDQYHGDFEPLAKNLNRLIDTLQSFQEAQAKIYREHEAGAIDYVIPVEQFTGVYASMANDVNRLVKAHIAVKMQAVDVVSRYARGDFSAVMERLPGKKAVVTKAVDDVRDSLRSMQSEILLLVEAAARGDLNQRADASKFEFGFHEMVDGINKTLDAIVAPLEGVISVLSALAKGDLTQFMSGEFQGVFAGLRDDANLTVDQLASIVRLIKEATESINTAAREIAIGNQDLSARTEQQASSLQETTARIERLADTLQQNADHATQANQMAVVASSVAQQGGAVVQRVVGTMADINESSRKIVDIIGVIDGIAFQTNILALNAAVEAARAGEQGRGFAVVAGEVRTLAQRSASAAREIKELIDSSVSRVSDGTRLVEEAGSTMDEIVVAVRRVTDIIGQIAQTSGEQSGGINQLNQAILQIDDATQRNAALVEEAAAAAESLQEQAGNLAQAVSRFRLDRQAPKRPQLRVLPHLV